MKTSIINAVLLLATANSVSAKKSSCANVLSPSYNSPKLKDGWNGQIIVQGLTKPRSILFDNGGGMLVIESGKGLSRIVLQDNGGTCLSVSSNTLLVNNTALNHGIALSSDQTVLYASTAESVFAWAYDAKAGTISGEPETIVTGMSNNDLTTRTLVMSKKRDNTLLVSRGSAEDYDIDALDVNSGLSQIRAFDLSASRSSAFQYDKSGIIAGWGLRNAVGVAEHPVTGGIYAVDNGIDDATRNGVDIHQENPGEELDYLGLVTDLKTGVRGPNFGYPNCFSIFNTTGIPDSSSLTVGSQISMTVNSTLNDTTCAKEYTAPRLTFPSHMAPLNILFSNDGATAYITFHGSTDKTNKVGYKLTSVSFDANTGLPTDASDSTTALTEIMTNPDLTVCPSACFRPVGMAWDSTGRLWVTSDSTGEIFVLTVASTASSTATTSGSLTEATGKSAAAGLAAPVSAVLSVVAAAAALAAF